MMTDSSTRAGTIYQPSDVAKEDVPKVPVNVRSIFAATRMIDSLKMEKTTAQLSTNTNAAQAAADAAAEEAAAGVSHDLHAAAKKAAASAAAPERAAAEQATMDAIKQAAINAAVRKAVVCADPERDVAVQAVIDAIERAAINADTEAAATVNNLRGEINRLQLLLATEQAAAADARAAANEAAATINRLEEENKRILLQFAAEQAATAVKVYVPGYNNPMTPTEYQQALERQIQYLQDQLHWHAQAIPVQWPGWADGTRMAETANVGEAVMASSPVPALTYEPSWKEHIPSQLGAPIVKSNTATYAQTLMMNSEPSSSRTVKRSTSTKDNHSDHSANAASTSATAGPEPARNLSVQQHEPAENLAAAALQAAADAAATAAEDPRILRAVLLAAAATANLKALAQTGAKDTGTVQPRRRGGRPPPTNRANPRPRPRRTRTPAATPAPAATGTRTARQSHQPPNANSLPREGRARPQPGARPPTGTSHRSTMPATSKISPKVEPTVMRLMPGTRD
jgi:hypothetical protein